MWHVELNDQNHWGNCMGALLQCNILTGLWQEWVPKYLDPWRPRLSQPYLPVTTVSPFSVWYWINTDKFYTQTYSYLMQGSYKMFE